MRRRLKYTLFGMIPVVLLVFFAGFFITGSFFLTRVLLPLISQRCGVEIAAAEMTWNPFTSTLRAKHFRVGPAVQPIFFAGTAAVRYDRKMFWQGGFRFSDIELERAGFSLYRRPDGRWSCIRPEPEQTKLEENVRNGARKRSDRKKRTPQFDLRRIRVRDSRFSLVYGDPAAGGAFELTRFSGECSRFANGTTTQIALAGDIRLSSSRANHIDSGRVKLDLDARLNEELLPCALELECSLDALEGEINGGTLRGGKLALELEAVGDDNEIDIERLLLTQSAEGKGESSADLIGRVSWKPFSFQVSCNAMKLSPEVMAVLFDLGCGFNPGHATLDCFGSVSYQDRSFVSEGRIRLSRRGDAIFGLERVALPDFELAIDHSASIDLESSAINLSKFLLTLDSQGRSTAQIRLRKPVEYSWLPGSAEKHEAAEFDLDFNELDLRLLRFAIPSEDFRIDSGLFSMHSQLIFRHNFSAFSILGNGRITAPAWRIGKRRFELEEVQAGIDGEVGRDLAFRLRDFSLALRAAKNRDFGSLHIDGSGSLKQPAAKLSGRFERLSPELVEWLSPSGQGAAAVWRRSGLDPATVLFSLEWPFAGGMLAISRFEAAVGQGSETLLKLTTEPFACRFRPLQLKENLKFTLTGAFPVSLLTRLTENPGWAVEGGRGGCDFSGSLSRNLTGAVLEGEIFGNDLALTLGNRNYRDFSLQNQFSLYLPDFKTLEIKTMNLYLRRQGKPALRLECPGVWELGEGVYRGDWAIRYLNEQFIALLAPDLAAEAQLFGKLQVLGRDNFRSLRMAGALECPSWQLKDRAVAPLSGKMIGVVERTSEKLALRGFSLAVEQDGKSLFDLAGDARVDCRTPEGSIRVKLHSECMDLERILAMRKHIPEQKENPPGAETVAAAGENRSVTPRLNFGRRPVSLNLAIDEIKVNTGIRLALESRTKFDRDRIATDLFRLRVNGAVVEAQLSGTSVPEGIRAGFKIKSRDPLELRPLVEMTLGTEEENLDGTLNEFSGEVSYLDTGRPGAITETLAGEVHAVLLDVKIPNTVTNGPLGQILLLPIEMIAELGTLLPAELQQWQEKIFSRQAISNRLKEISFVRGRVGLKAEQGKVKVEECSFFGDWVTRLFFSGSFDLTGRQELNLESRLTVGGVQFVIPVTGTLSAPTVDLQKFAASSFMDFVRKLSELKLIGLDGDPTGDGSGEPVILIRGLPTGEMIRELKSVFDGLFRQ